ncbi:hypothetical protein HPY31_28475 [Brevibacillus sp. HB1.3]|uniref:hypothetical protein n=1 Tax=Brevibacillus sp. HB1.3 TaxID=2738842 RepID=UPI0015529DA0|nr:hypothetical protein [Brevibacillus sp. HB1.3]NQF17804.1 hypothetical protein [Brevibacillus sp. HB1.3]
MPDKLRNLVEYTEVFTEKWLHSQLSQKEIYVIYLPLDSVLIVEGRLNQYVKQGGFTGTLVFAPRKQFTSWEDAFVGVFKKYVHHWESWSDLYGDNFSKEEVVHVLHTYIFPQYVDPNQMKRMNSTVYMENLNKELREDGVSEDFIQFLQPQLSNLEIVSIKDDWDDHAVFGISDSLVFIYLRIISH